MNIVPLDQIDFEFFASRVNTKFRVWIDASDSLELTLSEIAPRLVSTTGGANRQTYENFALGFLGPAERLLPQRMYWFESAGLGRFELFIVPVGRDANGVRYEATFNRLVKPD